jgi:predicted ester cyclase
MNSMLEANKQLCRDYFTAFLKRDTAWMDRYIAASFVRHDPGLPFEVRGPGGVVQLHDALMPAFPDMQLPLEDFVAEGEKVLVRLRVQATHTGPFGDLAATGRKIDIGVLDLFQIRGGRLIEHWALLDNLGMLKQLGVSTL